MKLPAVLLAASATLVLAACNGQPAADNGANAAAPAAENGAAPADNASEGDKPAEGAADVNNQAPEGDKPADEGNAAEAPADDKPE